MKALIASLLAAFAVVAHSEPYRFLPKHVMTCGPKKVNVVIGLDHFQQKDYVEISSDGSGKYVSYLHQYQFTTFDKQTYYQTPSLNGAQTWATFEKVGDLAIHTYFGVGMDGIQKDEKLIINLKTMEFNSKGFLLPPTGVCWFER